MGFHLYLVENVENLCFYYIIIYHNYLLRKLPIIFVRELVKNYVNVIKLY
jgi:hypothetical protein